MQNSEIHSVLKYRKFNVKHAGTQIIH